MYSNLSSSHIASCNVLRSLYDLKLQLWGVAMQDEPDSINERLEYSDKHVLDGLKSIQDM